LDLAIGGVTEIDALGPLGSMFVLAVGPLALSRDRGVGSTTGAIQIGGTTLLAAVLALIFYDSVNVETFIGLELIPAWTLAWTGYPQSIALIAIFSLGAAGYSAYKHRGVVEGALIWCQLTVLTSMHPYVEYPAGALLLMAAGVVLSLAVLQITYAMAYRDDLTGLPARRALMRDLNDRSTIDVDNRVTHDGPRVSKDWSPGNRSGSGPAIQDGIEDLNVCHVAVVMPPRYEHDQRIPPHARHRIVSGERDIRSARPYPRLWVQDAHVRYRAFVAVLRNRVSAKHVDAFAHNLGRGGESTSSRDRCQRLPRFHANIPSVR
jgi:hypothetical protein